MEFKSLMRGLPPIEENPILNTQPTAFNGPPIYDVLSGRCPLVSISDEDFYALAMAICAELADTAPLDEDRNVVSETYRYWLNQADTFFGFCLANVSGDAAILAVQAAVRFHRLPFNVKDMPNLQRLTSSFEAAQRGKRATA